MPRARYCYTVLANDTILLDDQPSTIKDVATAINKHFGIELMTVDMVNTHFTRPHKANKRMANLKLMSLERRRLPTKGELAQAELNKVLATVEL